MPVDSIFVDYSTRKLEQLGARVGECLRRLTPEQIWWRAGEESNAIGNLALHLAGNVRQWMVAGVGGAVDERDRDGEFAARESGGADLAALLVETVDEAVAVIRAESDLSRRVVIQGYDVTVLEAIYHVVEHFSGHTGQIILLTKALTGEPTDFYAFLSTTRAHEERTP